jgi:hypothetical protein
MTFMIWASTTFAPEISDRMSISIKLAMRMLLRRIAQTSRCSTPARASRTGGTRNAS